MKKILALLIALACAPAWAQLNPYTLFTGGGGSGGGGGSPVTGCTTANVIPFIGPTLHYDCTTGPTYASSTLTATNIASSAGKIMGNGLLSLFSNSSTEAVRIASYVDIGALPLTGGSGIGVRDVGFARSASNTWACGNGTAGDKTCTFQAGTLQTSGARTYVSSTAPTLASGGCTGAAMSGTQNGTPYFRAGVGTSCTLSQPLVFTLPAASSGWNCTARNVSNGATSAPAQTGAESTTSVTITNFVRATGVAGAWTDSDVIVVSCLGG